MEENFAQCFICSHFCKIREGQVGICGVHQNIGGKIRLINYGRCIAIHNDPIEKKPLFHFLPGTSVLSIGTMGCNLRCKNCQNWQIAQINGLKCQVQKYKQMQWGYHLSPEKIIEEALKCKAKSIAYTYNEPTVFLEYAYDTMLLAQKNDLKNVWVSNGFMSEETLDKIIPFLNAINIDLKSFSEDFYRSNCGASLKPILNNLRRLAKENVWLEITTLAIPSLSDDPEMFREIARFIQNELRDNVPWHISAFHPSYKLNYLPSTSLETIEKAYEIGKEEGLKHVYGGNIPGKGLENTYCSKCKETLIERIGYRTSPFYQKGECPKCKQALDGIFSP